MKQPDKESIKLQYLAFTDSLKSLMLSTVDEQGKPFISYAPFVKKDGKLYIYISRIANHFRYMESNPSVDVMLIEDEVSSENMFARQRARFVCQATNIGNEGYEDIFELFGEAFGKQMINVLKTLDFSLFELTTLQGRYVAGFGQAYDINLTAEQFDHVARDGHQQTKSS